MPGGGWSAAETQFAALPRRCNSMRDAVIQIWPIVFLALRNRQSSDAKRYPLRLKPVVQLLVPCPRKMATFLFPWLLVVIAECQIFPHRSFEFLPQMLRKLFPGRDGLEPKVRGRISWQPSLSLCSFASSLSSTRASRTNTQTHTAGPKPMSRNRGKRRCKDPSPTSGGITAHPTTWGQSLSFNSQWR